MKPATPADFLRTVIEAKAELEGPTPETQYARLDRNSAELDAALEAAVREDPGLGLNAVHPLLRYWLARGRLSVARHWVEQLLLAAGLEPTAERADGLFSLAAVAFREGDMETSRANAREALELAQRLGLFVVEFDSLLVLARLAAHDGEADVMRKHSRRARHLAMRIGDDMRDIIALGHLAEAEKLAGDYSAAGKLYQESLARNRQRGDRRIVALDHMNLGYVRKHEGDLEGAEALIREGVRLGEDLDNLWVQAHTLTALGAVVAARGRAEEAARLLGKVDAVLASGITLDPLDRIEFDAAEDSARNALGDDAFAAAHAQGAGLELEALLNPIG